MASMLRWPPLSIAALRRSDRPRSGNNSHSSSMRWLTPPRRANPPISRFSFTVRSGKMLETWGT